MKKSIIFIKILKLSRFTRTNNFNTRNTYREDQGLTMIIKIKELSPNKDAGQTTSVYLTGRTVSFECDAKRKLPKEFVVTYYDNFIQKGVYNGPAEEIDYGKYKDILITVQNHYRHLEHCPIPDYTVVYEDTQVVCTQCNKPSPHEDFYSDDYYGTLVMNICPICEISNYNFPKYETIDQFKERLR